MIRNLMLGVVGLAGIVFLGSLVETLFYHGFDEVMLSGMVALALVIWLRHNRHKEQLHEQPISPPGSHEGEGSTRH